MTSKWIDEVENILFYEWGEERNWTKLDSILNRIDGLLFQAMLSVENQDLSDKISEEINNGED